MNPLGWVEALGGVSLLTIVCVLLLLEEIGVPLPFAPGDLVLAVSGIAIAAGRVNPLLMVVCALAAVVVGAMLGRELFSLLGWARVERFARVVHAEVPLTKAGDMIDRSGWRAVFLARLIPGLRVYSTQMAGVRNMPRLRFLAGLVPAAVVYVAAFIGLGTAFGRPILAAIHRVEHEGLVIALVLGIAVAFVLLLRAPARRALQRAGGWDGLLTVRPTRTNVVLVPAAIGLDFAGHALAVVLHLPLFLDSIGTVLAGIVVGPWVGGSVGLLSDLLIAGTIDPASAAYAGVGFAIGFAAGLTNAVGPTASRYGWVTLWLVTFGVASTLATVIDLVFMGGHTGFALLDLIHSRLQHFRVPGGRLPAAVLVYISQAAIELPDKLVTSLAAVAIYAALPGRMAQPASDGGALNIGSAFTFVFKSPGWVRKLAVGAACVALSWLLLVPFLFFVGYLVAVAREARMGRSRLPAWDRLMSKLGDGLGLTVALLIWMLPGLALSTAGAIAFDSSSAVSRLLDATGTIWIVLVLLFQPAIWAQLLDSGFSSTLNPVAVVKRVVPAVGVTAVVGIIVWALAGTALLGFAVLIVGVLITLPYCSLVAARFFGDYARLTDRSRTGVSLGADYEDRASLGS